MDELSKTVMSWLIPFMFGGFILMIKSLFSAIEQAKDDLTDLKHMIARKYDISAYNLPKMQTVLDSSYCSYWASEKVYTNKKNSFNTYFSCHKDAFIKNDSVIPRTYKDWARKIVMEGLVVFAVVFILNCILSFFIKASDSEATSFLIFFNAASSLFFRTILIEFFIFLVQIVFSWIIDHVKNN